MRVTVGPGEDRSSQERRVNSDDVIDNARPLNFMNTQHVTRHNYRCRYDNVSVDSKRSLSHALRRRWLKQSF